MEYPIHSPDSATGTAKELLAEAERAAGFVPNLYGVMADAPALLEGYLALSEIFGRTSLTPTERQIVLLAVSFENGCDYCMAAHTVIAAMQGVPDDAVTALREGRPLADGRLEGLRRFTAAVVSKRGFPSPDDVAGFLGAGYSRAQVLEVVLGVGLKTLSNYTNHIARTPVDSAFAGAKWAPPGTR